MAADDLALLILAAILLALAGMYLWSVSWAIRDAQRRGQTGCLPIGLFILLGPFAAIAWLIVRPHARLVDKPIKDYQRPDDAFFAASQLDAQGEWDAAIALYRNTAQRWPEHQDYAGNCIEQIERKRTGR